MAHQTNAPDFACQRAEPCADLETVIAQQRRPDQRFVHARRHTHGIELRQSMPLLHPHGQTHGLETGHQRPVMLHVPSPGILQTFLLEDHQRFVKAIQRVDRSRMVIAAPRARAPIIHDQIHVQEPALHLFTARTNLLHGPVAEGDR